MGLQIQYIDLQMLNMDLQSQHSELQIQHQGIDAARATMFFIIASIYLAIAECNF